VGGSEPENLITSKDFTGLGGSKHPPPEHASKNIVDLKFVKLTSMFPYCIYPGMLGTLGCLYEARTQRIVLQLAPGSS